MYLFTHKVIPIYINSYRRIVIMLPCKNIGIELPPSKIMFVHFEKIIKLNLKHFLFEK